MAGIVEPLFGAESNSVFRKALMRFGHAGQIDVAIEEMAELTQALIKTRRYRGRTLQACEEIADVLIMVAQLRLIFGASTVDNFVVEKMMRLNGLVNAPVDSQAPKADNQEACPAR